MLNLFYAEADPDRWFAFDRYPRRVVRRLVRGAPQPGGQMRVLLNLCAGLDCIGEPYRVNDYRYVMRHRDEVACIVGKPFVLDTIKWQNPIVFGAAIHSHPIDDPYLLQRVPVRTVLVPGPWMKAMCEVYWGPVVKSWPVGIDTREWHPSAKEQKAIDVLLYDKVRWNHDRYEATLIEPIRARLRKGGYSVREIRYGHYREVHFRQALVQCRAMVFLCEHETQGIAYQQALSCGVPVLAWDRGGHWQDPAYYPHKVRFGPVTSVPYWDERCGMKFSDADEFSNKWSLFWDGALSGSFMPRAYVLENLTLEKCAREYVNIAQSVSRQS